MSERDDNWREQCRVNMVGDMIDRDVAFKIKSISSDLNKFIPEEVNSVSKFLGVNHALEK